MINILKNENLFKGLQTGDKIMFTCDGIMQSYPGQAFTYSCRLLEKGGYGDIPQRIYDSLEKTGRTAK